MAEEFRDDKRLVIMADVPGLRPDQISVSITADTLHISARRDDELAGRESDLRDGRFTRDIRLPAGTDEWSVTASYAEGVLEIRAPMRDLEGVTREVPVIFGDHGAESTETARSTTSRSSGH
jgi:HSP20 family protein